MHESSWEKMEQFVEVYLGGHRTDRLEILDVGSQLVVDTQATYRSLFAAPGWNYTGLDVAPGLNVDVAVADPYRWDELSADTFDVVISGQALEHIPMFWVTSFEIGRVLRPGGITMLIAPSSGWEHRYPVDCWRFYRDGMRAIADYLGFDVLEAYTEWGRPDWEDSVLVMRKPAAGESQRRLLLRRRELQQAAARGTEPPAVDTGPLPTVAASVLTGGVAGGGGGVLEPALESIRAVALAPPPPKWRTLARKVAGARVVGLYRRLRYGRTG